MRYLLTNETSKPLQRLIDVVLEKMNETDVNSDEYSDLMEKLERLYQLKAKERREPVSRDTIAIIAGNLAGILLIVAYEQRHVMTSKGFSQILRPRTPQQL